MKLSKEKRDRLLLVSIITLVVLGLMYQFLIQPSRTTLQNVQVGAARARTKYEDADRFMKRAPVVDEELQQVGKELAEIEDQMAPAADPFTWSYQLMTGFARQGNNVEVIEVLKPTSATVGLLPEFPYAAVVFGVRGRGYYEELGKFIAAFENRYPFFRTQNLLVTVGSLEVDRSGARPADRVDSPEKLAFQFDVVALVKPAQ